MEKILSPVILSGIIKKLKNSGKTVGFVTGCFDVIHISHINYFVAAKRRVDILVVGVDNDKSIRLSKGEGRPIFGLNVRCRLLKHLDCVDFVVPLTKPMVFGTDEAYGYLLKVTRQISPDYLISNSLADKYWKNVKKRANDAGCGFIDVKLKPGAEISTSSKIIEKLQKEI